MAVDCEKAKKELEEYLHNELCKEDASDIRAHIESCPDCAAEHKVGQVLTDTVQRAHKEECAPEQLRADLMSRLRTLAKTHEVL